MEFGECDGAGLSLGAKNLSSARRHLGPGWLDSCVSAVEVTSAPGNCRCGVGTWPLIVFNMRRQVKPELSDAPLCAHQTVPVPSIIHMVFDRAAEGLNASARIWRHVECPMTGADHGASEARAEVHLRDGRPHEPVTGRVPAPPAP